MQRAGSSGRSGWQRCAAYVGAPSLGPPAAAEAEEEAGAQGGEATPIPARTREVQLGTANIATLWKHSTVALEAAGRYGIEILCLQETQLTTLQLDAQSSRLAKAGWRLTPGTTVEGRLGGRCGGGRKGGGGRERGAAWTHGGLALITTARWQADLKQHVQQPGGEAAIYELHSDDQFLVVVNLHRRINSIPRDTKLLQECLSTRIAAYPMSFNLIMAGDFNADPDSAFTWPFTAAGNVRFLPPPAPTRPVSGTYLDFFSVRSDGAALEATIRTCPDKISDHLMVHLSLPLLLRSRGGGHSDKPGDQEALEYRCDKVRQYPKPKALRDDDRLAAWLAVQDEWFQEQWNTVSDAKWQDPKSALEIWESLAEDILRDMMAQHPEQDIPPATGKRKQERQLSPYRRQRDTEVQCHAQEHSIRRYLTLMGQLDRRWDSTTAA